VSVLYISYDGMLEPLGQSQVLAYLERLAKDDEIHLLSFEKARDWQDAQARKRIVQRIRDAGIHWHPRRYHKRLTVVATTYDILIGTLTALWLGWRHRLRIMHARSDVAMLMAWLAAPLTGARLLWDMRGFWADERVEGGIWKSGGRLYRTARWFEKRFLRSADHVVTLTRAAERVMQSDPSLPRPLPPITVIPTCADLERFRPQPARAEDGFVFGYVGSVGTRYEFDAAVDCFRALRELRPDARWLIVNRNDHAYVRERLRAGGISEDCVEIKSAAHADVPAAMARMDAAVCFCKPSASAAGVALTKLAEMLGCGVPCIGNAGVGDTPEVLEGERVGVVVESFDAGALQDGARRLLRLVADPDVAARCIAAARRHYSLDLGVDSYRAIYARLSSRALRPRVLYLSYDGMLEPLGQSQVLAYVERLARDSEIHLLSFEKAGDWQDAQARGRIAQRIRDAGIHWHPRRYHKRLSVVATTYDILIGTLTALWLGWRHRLRIMHARSDVAMLMAWLVAPLTGARLLWDMRGFWAEERVDGDLWPRDGRLYRVACWFERRFLTSADRVVSLTEAAVKRMQADPALQGRLPPIAVIPTCADLARFRPMRTQPPPGFVLGYVGSAGTRYEFDAAAACFGELRALRPDARWMIVNRNDHAYIRERLHAAGIPEGVVELKAAGHADVPALMASMHAGIFFYKPLASALGCSPTKLGEFLGCGIPCLVNTGVGDSSEILAEDRAGVATEGFDADSLRAGVRELVGLAGDPGIADRCVATARRHFALESGVALYDSIYRELSGTLALNVTESGR
jgi:glycosyltransferase involved in cell wall biosynthesis